MTDHTLQREYEGEGITRQITPTCSCGWRGIGYQAHNDHQYSLVADQENEHISKAMRERDDEKGK